MDKEIKKILIKKLEWADCDNCKYDNEEDGEDEDNNVCCNCRNKYSYWTLSENILDEIVKEIDKTIVVNKLRDMTGAGMMDCKKTLVECNGDIEEAIKYLKKKRRVYKV